MAAEAWAAIGVERRWLDGVGKDTDSRNKGIGRRHLRPTSFHPRSPKTSLPPTLFSLPPPPLPSVHHCSLPKARRSGGGDLEAIAGTPGGGRGGQATATAA